jgi:hypothetical protein
VVRFFAGLSYDGRRKLATSFDDALKSAMFDLNALTAKHDARVLAASCLSKGAYLYQQLRMMGIEKPETLEKIFALYLKLAQEDGERARVLTETPAITGTSH